jgi:hypothetical protein
MVGRAMVAVVVVVSAWTRCRLVIDQVLTHTLERAKTPGRARRPPSDRCRRRQLDHPRILVFMQPE